MVCCFTGLAYIDVAGLTQDNIRKSFDGNIWIMTKRQKTNTDVNVPLLDIPKMILKKYKGKLPNGKILPVISNQKLNAYLKEIADICGIKKNLTFHMARHSFATLICLGNGVPIETISRMMGHSSIRTTQIYAEITNQKVNRDLLRLADTTKNQYSLPDDKMTPRVYQCGRYNGWKEEEDKDDNRTSGKAM